MFKSIKEMFSAIKGFLGAAPTPKESSNTELHAIREFKAAGYLPTEECEDGPDKWIQESVLELIRVFSAQGHSGFSAPYCVETFRKLALHEPLVPLSGDADEWVDTGDGVFQNNRCSRVFKDSECFNGQAYDIQGTIFREPNGCCYTNSASRVPITFPYSPSSIYLDVAE